MTVYENRNKLTAMLGRKFPLLNFAIRLHVLSWQITDTGIRLCRYVIRLKGREANIRQVIPVERFQKLESMLRRVAAIINAT
ncbi:hypothetical protein TNCV_1477241 [Trichonephila clavipes]|nr:hypothetical protein TNCV_1477241 [Trichonephila clavipes]